MQLMIDAIKDKVTTASWKMVYASSDSEFDALWDQMVADCNGLDANSISEGFGISLNPSSSISNTPISFVEPKRFLTPRKIRYAAYRSPSK